MNKMRTVTAERLLKLVTGVLKKVINPTVTCRAWTEVEGDSIRVYVMADTRDDIQSPLADGIAQLLEHHGWVVVPTSPAAYDVTLDYRRFQHQGWTGRVLPGDTARDIAPRWPFLTISHA